MSEYKYVPVEILDRFPEINPSNYGPDEVDALNAWGIELVLAAAPTQPAPAEADDAELVSASGASQDDPRFIEWLSRHNYPEQIEEILSDKTERSISFAVWNELENGICTKFPAESDKEAVRNSALEEAAALMLEWADNFESCACPDDTKQDIEKFAHTASQFKRMVKRIRALKSQPAQPDKSSSWVTPEPNPFGNSTIYNEGWYDACEACERLNKKPAQPSDSNMVEKHQIKNQPSDSQAEVSDTEMLDFLINDGDTVCELKNGRFEYYSYGMGRYDGESPREAIKAAMRAQEES